MINAKVTKSIDFQDVFLKNWPTAKTVLAVLQRAVKNRIIKLVIGFVINLGDELYNNYEDE